jgi:signal transduction histidine kinase
MTQLVLHGEVAQHDLPPGSDTRLQMEGFCQEARQLLSTMDEILWAVNPQRDTLRDFSSYVCDYAQTFLKPTSIQCLFEVDPEMSTATLALPLRRNLLLAIKETLNNAVKYSQATELHLKIQWKGRQLIVVVQDNGKGFDPANVKPGRNGLSNMVERMEELGGSCRITSQPGCGCHVEFGIPLVQASRYTFDRMWGARCFRERIDNSQGRADMTAQRADD